MKLTIEQTLQQGVAAHKKGKLQEAERLYRAVLQSQPTHPDANHNLGVLAVSVNKAEAALPLFKIALDANPKMEQFWLSYIDALIKEKQFENAKEALYQGKESGLSEKKVEALEERLNAVLSNLETKNSKQNKFSLAIEFREAGKYQEAQEWLNTFIASHPNEPEALSLLSQVLLLDKKDAESEKVLLKAASLNSELPSIYLNQARLLLKQSKPVEALEKGQSGYERSPNDPESWLVLAACLGANQRDQDALPLIEKVLEARPNYAEAFASRALIWLRAKDISEAIKDAEMSVSLKPHLTQIWGLLGSLHYQSNNLSGATQALKKAHENEPNNVDYMIGLGEFLRQENKVGEAIAILEKATKLAPGNANGWTNLGVAFQQDKQIDNAKKAYEKSVAINPKLAEVSSKLGLIAMDARDWDSALQYFEKALVIKPDLAEGHSGLGTTLQKMGRLEEAEASYTQAIALKSDFAEAHYSLGNLLKELGRLEEAEASYRQAVAMKPDYAEAHHNLGAALQELGRLGETEANLRRAIALKPDLAEAHYNLGNTLKELGRLEEAEASYTQAIALKPDYTDARYSLGLTFNTTGKFEEAIEQFSLINFKKSKSHLLRCLYLQDKRSLFFDLLDTLINQGEINSMIGSLGCRSLLTYGIERPNLFCKEPLKYVLKTDLKNQYDFGKIFVDTAITILNDNRVEYRAQRLLTNGSQTYGNLFDLEPDFTEEIQNIIRAEVDKYRFNLKDSEEGFIKNWPADYSISGWLVSMRNGGELRPHMHSEGWISGSIYINVPPKLKTDSGNFVVCIEDETLVRKGVKNPKKSIDVVTGSLVLFPASLLHYTIPFESEEERIVLAFDVVPK